MQKLRIVRADAPARLNEPRTKDAKSLYAALASQSCEVSFTEMVTVDIVQTTQSSQPKSMKGENDNCRYEFKLRRLRDDKWMLNLTLTEKEAPNNSVQTSVIIESGTLLSLGGYTKTDPKSGKTTTKVAFVEISPSFAELPGSGVSH